MKDEREEMGVCEYEWARGKEIGMKEEKNKDEG